MWKGESGQRYTLTELQSSCPQALYPYDGVAGFSSHTHSFNGQTFFRFPLRNKPSNLSSEVSTIDSVRQLLQALKNEAKFLLLFLRSVCSIEVIEILDTHKQQTSFKVSISSCDALLHKQQQQSLLKQVETTFTGSYPYSIECIIQQSNTFSIELYNNGVVTEHEWLVVHRVGCEDKEVLALAQQQHVLPWVGTAVEISKECDSNSKGRIFCCIPLPTEDRAPFNVCVNGTFAVSSNRRSLNWESQERQGDSEGLWNKYLVEKCIPQCYCELIQQVMKIPSISPETVYQCWPVTHHVKQTPWAGLLKPLFVKLLYSKSVVHANPSDWISLSNAALVPNGETLPDSVQVLLVSLGLRVVTLTAEQWNVLNEYYSNELHTITPHVVRGLMRENDRSYSNNSFSKKIELLQYCLSDQSYSDLSDLELIPVANGSFIKFSSPRVYSYFSSHSTPPYVCTSSIRHDLLPGVDNVMVDLLDNDATTHGLLVEVARSNETQLSVVNESVIAKLVPQSDPQSWSQSQLEKFWIWLQNYNLKAFNGLQIVPVKHTNGSLSIHKLTSKQSSLVFVSHYASQRDLTANLRSALEKYGVDLACEYEFPYMNHPQLSSCMNQFVVGEVVDCTLLHAIKSNQLTDQEASEMQSFLIKCQIDVYRIKKMCEMKIFLVIQDDSNRFSVNQVKTREQGNVALAQGNDFLFRTDLLPKHPMILKSGQSLLQNLKKHVLFINGIECLEKVAFVSIKNRSLPVDSIMKFMLSVLDNLRALIQRYPNQRIFLLNALFSLPFVLVESGHLMAPSSLFDPRDQLLVQLYQTQHVFPYDTFSKYTDELVLCGLKNSKSVTASIMNDILNKISVHCGWYGKGIIKCDTTTISRVNGFFKFLTKYPHLLNDPIGGYRSLLLKDSILQRATSHALFPVASSKPMYYPSSLNWMGSEHSDSLVKYDSSQVIVLPNTVNHHCCPDPTIIGSKVIFVERIPQLLCSHVPKSNLANRVLQHFQHVIDNESNLDSDTLEQIALKTYDYLNSTSIDSVVNVLSVGKLIWIESRSKFVEPHLCVLNNNTSFNNNLEPFHYILPKKMRKYEEFFCRFDVSRLLQNEQIVSVLTSIKTNSMNISSNEAWTLVKSILDWLVATKVDSDNVLVPITCDDDNSYPDLHPVSEVCYTDNEMLLEIAQSSDEEYKLVHPSIAHLASQLGLTPLSDQLDITEEVFQDAGQHEPLTTRLSNILREYKDGLTIIKELVQNADDADATEVNILYDGRQHTTDKLLFKGMAASHGPALVVHNNATFTEDDFANITKLAGATKKDKPLKIGKFGVGFCSVYHITDVPSFVSGEWLYIFDPTLNHLKGVVKNENQPGKRVKHSSKFISKSKQLVPYKNLFQFSLSESYNGTMFRFPFRTHASQISSTIYSESMIDALKNDIADSGKKMLLFLSHVRTLNFLTIQAGNSSPREEIVIEKIECGGNIVRIETKVSTRSSNPTVEYWLVSNVSNSVYDVYEKEYRPSVSSVACQFCITTDGKYKVVAVDGSVFCYLPLSVPCTGLPVHISANFAVMSNRSGIWTSSSSATPSDSREWWNQQLIKTIIPEAYCNLLVMLKSLQDNGMLLDYNFFELFPLISELKVHHPWKTMIENMYSKMLQKKLLFCKCLGEWLHLNECQFLSHDVLSLNENDIPKCVVDSVQIMKLPIVDVPQKYLVQFQLTSKLNVINEERFCQIFFSNILEFSDYSEIRNEVLYNMYLVASKDYNMRGWSCIVDMLMDYPSVPCTPHGISLKLASSLVDPHCELKELFDSDSEMFPCQSFTDSKPVHQLMIDIGLLNTTLPWDIIVECAKSIETVYTQEKNKALMRIKVILKCIREKLTEDKISKSKNIKRPLAVLMEIKFIPVASKPDDYISLWKGSEMTLSSPSCMFYPHPSSTGFDSKRQHNIRKECFLLGSQKIIVNSLPIECGGCGSIPHSVVVALGFQMKPNVEEIIDNYVCLIQEFEEQLDEIKIGSIEYLCRITYEFLENELKKCNESELPLSEAQMSVKRFQDQPFVWFGNKFISPQNIATRWKEKGPYLYELPSILSERKLLIEALCIKEKFTINKLLKTLKAINVDFCNEKLNMTCLKTVDAIISELISYIPDDYKDIDKDSVILPSHSHRLLCAKNLSFNDSKWLPVSDDCILVHPILTREVALALGVNPVRSQFLDKYATCKTVFGSDFGQREELTQRIKNILRDYPLDATLIKELLQNADDAKATKMCVILDKRQHGTKKIPSEEWSDLQGPALLVWNNEEFTQKDLEGIQKLGLGSKRDDSESIGQFGIGFNVVYHVTDCPSLITGGKTLCVFDPHCKYAPGAKPLNPGRRYDDLENTFWNAMSDLKSAYFQCDPITSQPSDIDIAKGSLFRLPLRNISTMKQSKIVDDVAKPLTAAYIETELDDWILQIKDALVFLNHIAEFSYYVVDNSGFHLKYQYKIIMDSSAVKCRKGFFRASKEFKQDRQPFVVNYQISMDCIQPNKVPSAGIAMRSPFIVSSTIPQHLKSHEEWFIQQGIGDLNSSQQKWRFIDRVLPKHGIASPINQTFYFKGKVFCFLPLPGESGLPVHINGQFVLSSNRRSLWAGDPESNDEKKEWNDNLMEAIASSYVHYLTEARHVFVKDREYTDKRTFFGCINQYYHLYPFHAMSRFENNCLRMVRLVFLKLWKANSEILATEVYLKARSDSSKPAENGSAKNVTSSSVMVEWNALRSEDAFKQVYFQPRLEKASHDLTQIEAEKKVIISFLKCIKLKLTCAPHILYKHFVKEEFKPAIANPESVFQFYCNFYQHSFTNGCPSCSIEESPFKTVNVYRAFLSYVLSTSSDIQKVFPDSPFGYPLLLTADNVVRCFDQNTKVMCTSFHDLFPNTLYKFLHRRFASLGMSSDYFLSTSSIDYSIVDQLLQENYSIRLRQKCLNNRNQQFIDTERLMNLWKCLVSETDQLLKQHQWNILNSWALTPAKNKWLYSTSSDIVPVIPPDGTCEFHNVYKIFLKFDLPVINFDHLPDCAYDCIANFFPTLSDCDRILEIMYHLHIENSVFDNLSPSTNDPKHILAYFARTKFLHSESLRNKIKQLPLYKSINERLTTLSGKKVYLWPSSGFCDAGYNKWAPPQSVVFLEYYGDWRHLTNDFSVIGTGLNEKNIYSELIFPSFPRLSSEERQKHLEYIKDHIYESVKVASEYQGMNTELNDKKKIAMNFIMELRRFECIEHPETKQLTCVCNFSDHTVPIFSTFKDHFIFLPQQLYQSKTWIDFFRELGLQVEITPGKFIDFCSVVEKGTHENVKEASQILLQYLFKQGPNWEDFYLQQIVKICFVPVADLPHLSWIKAPCSPHEIQCNTGSVCLTRLDQSLLIDSAPLVWTVKPIFTAPECVTWKEENEKNALLKRLKVNSTPAVDDVICNLVNLSKSRFSSYGLFDNYPSECVCTQDSKKVNLVKILCESFKFLEELDHPNAVDLLSQLQQCPCIPVPATSARNDTILEKVVLVKPVEVVKHLDSADEKLNPYINQLPSCLSQYSSTLSVLGVLDTVGLVHIQHILEILHSLGRTTNPNQIKVMHHSLTRLNELMRKSDYSKKIAAKLLTPLYLPFMDGNGWSLKPSVNLVFVDNSRYKARDPKHFDLTKCQYSLFQNPVHTTSLPVRNRSQSHSFDLSFNEKSFCLSLPSGIRPQALSLCVQEARLNVGSKLKDSNNIVLAYITQSKILVEDFRQILPHMLSFNKERESSTSTQFVDAFVNIINSLNIEVIDGLKAKLLLDGNSIGTLTSPLFVLEGESQPYTLYIDNKVTGNGCFWSELSLSLLIQIAKLLKEVNIKAYFQMIQPIAGFFQAHDIYELKCLAEQYSVELEISAMHEQEIEDDNFFDPKLGKQVPEELINRSDSVINNIFRPQDWVAYEVSEEYFIWAIVLYSTGTQNESELPKYTIVIENGDENGIEVSIVDLYKIVSSIEEIEAAEGDQSLVPIDEDSATAQVKQVKDTHSVLSLKKSVCEDLRCIWKLKNEDEKRKALKRLYLKYHPDKVGPEFKDVYEEVFKFLLRQIDRLENNLPLEDPDKASEESVKESMPETSHWTPQYRQWDTYVPKYKPRSAAYSRQRTDSSGNYPHRSYQPETNENEAKRWLKQAWTDCKAMRLLRSYGTMERGSQNSVVCQIIFMAREVIEKSLKAGMYKLCGLNPGYLTSHEILCHARSICSLEAGNRTNVPIVHIAEWIAHFYLDSRFPNRHSDYSAPVDVYSQEDAMRAADYAEMVIEFINDIICKK